MRPPIAVDVPVEVRQLFETVKRVVDALPEKITVPYFIRGKRMPASIMKSGLVPSCHMITRALTFHFPVQQVSGYVVEWDHEGKSTGHQHSWLVPSCNDGYVIDVWPIGNASGPTLIKLGQRYHYSSPFSILYDTIKDPAFDCVVAVTRSQIRKILRRTS